MVGMNAVVMDNVEVGDESIVGALCFIKANEKIPARSIVVGNPHKIVKEASDDMINWKTDGTKIYMGLPKDCYVTLREVEPLREIPENRKKQESGYKTWKEISK